MDADDTHTGPPIASIEGLAYALGVTAESLEALGFKRHQDDWRCPERNSDGEIIGWSRRLDNGKKMFVSGGKRGLTMALPMPSYAGTSLEDPVLIVEGASDTAAGLDLGFATVGRPSATGGVKHLAPALKGRHVVIVAENDDGPGVDGAYRVGKQLVEPCASVRVVLPPPSCKDLRAWRRSAELDAVKGELRKAIDASPALEPPPAKSSSQSQGRRGGGEDTASSTLLSLLEEANVDVIRGSDGLSYATFKHLGARQTHQTDSSALRRWMRHLFRAETGSAIPSANIRDVIDTIAGDAEFAGRSTDVFMRVGAVESERAVYIDLCDEKWRTVRCTPDGWSIVSEPEVRFRRASGALPLPEPVSGGSVRELAELLNFGDSSETVSETEILILGWLVSAFRWKGPYPLLAIGGEQGSAKSTTSQALRGIIDPHVAPHRSLPRSIQDLAVAAENSYVLNFDNLSYIPDELSDGLCRIATGSGFGTRALYSGRNEEFFQSCRPIMLNGITELAGRPDLLERAFAVRLPAIPAENRMRESVFWRKYEEARPRIFGAVLEAVCEALQNEELIVDELKRLPRMADAAVWVTASEPAMGIEMGTFLKTHEDNQASAASAVIESSMVGATLLKWLKSESIETWKGTASELYDQLTEFIGEEKAKKRKWPNRPAELGKGLQRLTVNLREIGVDCNLTKENWDAPGGVMRGVHVWSINVVGKAGVPPQPTDGADQPDA